MFEKLKWYLVQIGIKKYVPMGVMSAMGVLGTFMAANAGKLEPWGVNYIPQWSADWLTTHSISGPVLLIELDTTSAAVIALVVGIVTIAMRATEHHVNAVAPVMQVEPSPEKP